MTTIQGHAERIKIGTVSQSPQMLCETRVSEECKRIITLLYFTSYATKGRQACECSLKSFDRLKENTSCCLKGKNEYRSQNTREGKLKRQESEKGACLRFLEKLQTLVMSPGV